MSHSHTITMADCCSVCVEAYNNTAHKPVRCNTCDFTVCIQCFEHYQMDHSGMYDVHCMSCKQLWDDQYVRENIASATIKRLASATKKRLRDEETAFMPETQMYVEYGNAVETVKVSEYMNMVKQVQDMEYRCIESEMIMRVPKNADIFSIKKEIELKKSNMFALKNRISRWRRARTLSVGFKDIMPEPLYQKHFRKETNQDEKDPNRLTETIVLCPCPTDQCRGFVTRKEHKCGVCDQHVCNKCLTPTLSEEDHAIHVCNESDIQSAKLIFKSSKPCPKCAIRIHKIDGCDQMWCTQCNTSFSWNTGREIVGQVIHNPHYYVWLRTHIRSAGTQEGIRGCDGVPDVNHLDRHLSVVFRNDRVFRQQLLSIHRSCVHYREVEIRNRMPPQHPDDLFRKNMDIRMNWLMKKTTDKNFESMLHKRYKKTVVNQRIIQVYELLTTLCSDVFHRLLHTNENTDTIRNEFLTEFREINAYVNECFKKLDTLYKVKMPRVGLIAHAL